VSGKRDLNSRPRPWQGRALPTELFPQYVFGVWADPFRFGLPIGIAKIGRFSIVPKFFEENCT
jgi:hypothetical protein